MVKYLFESEFVMKLDRLSCPREYSFERKSGEKNAGM